MKCLNEGDIMTHGEIEPSTLDMDFASLSKKYLRIRFSTDVKKKEEKRRNFFKIKK